MQYSKVLPGLLMLALSMVTVIGCESIGDLTNVADKVEGLVSDVADVSDKAGDVVDDVTSDLKSDGNQEDSTTFENDIQMNLSSWIKVNTGEWEETVEGIK